ncbi:MAG: hypothetical protein ABIS21_06310 [Acidimicrobiales bacterium]
MIDDHFLRRYRELLDAEDGAFDDLEHAYEDGDRACFEANLKAWESAIQRKLTYLRKLSVRLPEPTPVG